MTFAPTTTLRVLAVFAAIALAGSVTACKKDEGGSSTESTASTATPSTEGEGEAAGEGEGEAAGEGDTAAADPTPPPADPPAAAGGTFTLAPGFTPDPHTVGGVAGGSRDAGDLSTDTVYCTGMVPTAPQHTMVLSADFEYLRIVAASDDDTTLVIEGPAGRMCNDDFEGLDAGFAGPMAAGSYQIFVGTFHDDERPAYTLRVTEFSE
jgi:hypothetical protein